MMIHRYVYLELCRMQSLHTYIYTGICNSQAPPNGSLYAIQIHRWYLIKID